MINLGTGAPVRHLGDLVVIHIQRIARTPYWTALNHFARLVWLGAVGQVDRPRRGLIPRIVSPGCTGLEHTLVGLAAGVGCTWRVAPDKLLARSMARFSGDIDETGTPP